MSSYAILKTHAFTELFDKSCRIAYGRSARGVRKIGRMGATMNVKFLPYSTVSLCINNKDTVLMRCLPLIRPEVLAKKQVCINERIK